MPHSGQVSIVAFLTLGAGLVFIMRPVLGFVGCLAVPLDSTRHTGAILSPGCEDKKRSPDTPSDLWGALRTPDFKK